jgi:hypothetical protein
MRRKKGAYRLEIADKAKMLLQSERVACSVVLKVVKIYGAECSDGDFWPYATCSVSPLYRFIGLLHAYLKFTFSLFVLLPISLSSLSEF